MRKNKWYVVWKGNSPGVYSSWNECKDQIDGFEHALYKSFDLQEDAVAAFHNTPWDYIGKNTSRIENKTSIVQDSLSVDAACSGNPGRMEYRGVYTATGEEIFHSPIFEEGTNNIGEFLALVHGLALLKKQKSDLPIYSDSVNAIKWIRDKKCKTKLEPTEKNQYLFELIDRAENWLKNNPYNTQILKWNTKEWGEIPADFGRK